MSGMDAFGLNGKHAFDYMPGARIQSQTAQDALEHLLSGVNAHLYPEKNAMIKKQKRELGFKRREMVLFTWRK